MSSCRTTNVINSNKLLGIPISIISGKITDNKGKSDTAACNGQQDSSDYVVITWAYCLSD